MTNESRNGHNATFIKYIKLIDALLQPNAITNKS